MNTIKERLIKEYWIEKALKVEAYPFGEATIEGNEGGDFVRTKQGISPEIIEKVKHLAGGNEVTEFVTWLSFYCILLNKYYERNEIVVTSPRFKSEQHGSGHDALNFFMINIEDKDSVKDVLIKVRKEVVQALNYQQFDFQELKSHFERNGIPYEGLYQVGFTMGGLFESTEFDQVSLRFTLDLDAEEPIIINYDKSKFDDFFISQLALHFVRLLEQGLSDYDTSAADLSLLTGEERDQILNGFNNTQTAYPDAKSIVALFEEQVAVNENKLALTYDGVEVTYGELNRRANKLAYYLKENAGLGTGDKVAIFLDRSDHYIVSLLGILKAGAAYAPIDPNAPEERIKYILQDLKPKAVITVSEHIFEFDEYDGELVSIDIQEDSFDENVDGVAHDLNADHMAYVMYTSGTTGNPKGVTVSHRNVVRLVINSNYVELDESSSMIMTGSVAFDATTYEIWGTLLNGAVLHILSKNDLMDARVLKTKVHELTITHMWFTTSWFNQLVTTEPDIFSQLKYLVVGGEKSSPKYFNKVRTLSDSLKIRHVYGPTENTTFSTYYAIDEVSSRPFPIGKPISNSTAYILNKHGKPVPVGVEGEICLGGDGVAMGYLNKPQLTEERFVPNTFQGSGYIYKSGDRGKWLPDGSIEFIGRNDNQIKLRGFRIELNEIANALNQLPEIQEASIIHVKKEVGDGYLVAYLVSQKPVDEVALKEYLKRHIPDYMIPTYFIALDRIPLTVNGKIDRRALPDPEKMEHRVSGKYEAPQGEIEEKMVDIWQKVLNQSKIGVHDNFFELGGHSLKATQVLMEVHQELEAQLEIGDIFKQPTIRELAQIVQGRGRMKFEEIPALGKQEYYELSHGQRRLWILDQFEEEHKAYTIPRAFTLENIDLDTLEKAFVKMIQRHEVLRTTFVSVGDEPRQRIQDPDDVDFKIHIVDLREVEDQEKVLQKLSADEAGMTFNLGEGPLLKASLALLDEKNSVLFLTMHHIISDYWSSNVFFNEMQAFYMAISRGETTSLEPLRIQYKDYAAWQRQQLLGENRDRHKQYWRDLLGGDLPQLQLPLDNPRPGIKTTNGAAVYVTFPKEIGQKLKQLNRKNDSTTFNTLLTVIYGLLYRWSGQQDVIIGAPVVGRDHKDLAGQIGLYINTLPIRINQPVDNSTFEELLAGVRKVTVEALSHQMYPLDLVMEDLNVRKDPSRSMLFDVMVQILSSDSAQADEQKEEDDVNIEGYKQQITTCSFDMIFDLVLAGDDLKGVIKYNTDLFQEETIIILRDRFSRFLEDILDNPEKEIDQLSFQTVEEAENKKALLSKEFDF
ncbi:amino acid adenylation domain-containing protein [Fulvivirga sp. 29W222]|uniref:Amino acid adenylation domain-containing protein n=1 Tax=Fulvivirga marina TaxID=2494733 RepID=A0A937G289_9BACT|nr:non-ribosomal peptide synthetase [Fulvivirga marina]MBL6449158.1 amino acid adenylation domain-containing protein [Fulvivirga marina]